MTLSEILLVGWLGLLLFFAWCEWLTHWCHRYEAGLKVKKEAPRP
jgi:hypothetical protein